jgi:hypothetical protein
VDRGKGSCKQAATNQVSKPARAVRAMGMAATRRVLRTIPPTSRLPFPRFRQYYGERIGFLCFYIRDVGVAGSNPVTQTIDFIRVFPPCSAYGSRSTKLTVPKTVPVSAPENRANFGCPWTVREASAENLGSGGSQSEFSNAVR